MDGLDDDRESPSPPPSSSVTASDILPFDQRTSDQSSGTFTETDATIISQGSPLPSHPNVAYLHPRELGKALEGRRLDHFELVEFIGGGGMGAVFRAHDTQLDRTVAVKVLAKAQANDADDAETRLRFRNEAQSAARLDHKNIARVHYVGEDRGVHYIVFEYIDGINVRELVRSRGMPSLEESLSYTLQIAEALAHAGRREVVHRDIKPSNILITADGQAKLVDMGLARMQHVGRIGDELTASGVTLGTFDYISPEQAREPRDADTRSDIYSLGCTFYFMLTGEPPFPEGTVLQKLLKHQGDLAPNPRTKRPDLPSGICDLIGKMLAKSPEDRYQTPDEVIAAILIFSEQIGLSPARTTTTPVILNFAGNSMLRRHLPWLVPVVLLAVAVFLLDLAGQWRGTLFEPDMRPSLVSRASSQAPSGPPVSVDPSGAIVGNPDGLPPEPPS